MYVMDNTQLEFNNECIFGGKESPKSRRPTRLQFGQNPTTVGKKIRNAVSGSYYDFKIGSEDEQRFWKMKDSSGQSGELSVYYYDSPEQYENHWNCVVSTESKGSWKNYYLEKFHS